MSIYLKTDGEMSEFLSHVENTTDTFADQAKSQLIREIHKRVVEVKQSEEMEVEYMTLLQRDRKNLELAGKANVSNRKVF